MVAYSMRSMTDRYADKSARESWATNAYLYSIERLKDAIVTNGEIFLIMSGKIKEQ